MITSLNFWKVVRISFCWLCVRGRVRSKSFSVDFWRFTFEKSLTTSRLNLLISAITDSDEV